MALGIVLSVSSHGVKSDERKVKSEEEEMKNIASESPQLGV